MQIISHPPGRGLTWLTDGIRILMRQPVALLMLTFIQLMLILLPAVVPVIGGIISVSLIPALYLGLMTAIRETERGETPNPGMLFVAFQPESDGIWKKLLLLGLISGIFAMVMLFVAELIAPMPASNLAPGAAQDLPGEATRMSADLAWPMILASLVSLPVQMAFWYSPMFVGWHGVEIGKAVFFSIATVWRNRGAFAMLLLGWLLVIVAVNMVLALIIAALGVSTALLTVLLAPTLLILLTGAYCSFWVTYRDVVQ